MLLCQCLCRLGTLYILGSVCRAKPGRYPEGPWLPRSWVLEPGSLLDGIWRPLPPTGGGFWPLTWISVSSAIKIRGIYDFRCGDKTMTLLSAINTEYNPVGKITFDSSHCNPLLLILRRLILLLCSRLISAVCCPVVHCGSLTCSYNNYYEIIFLLFSS